MRSPERLAAVPSEAASSGEHAHNATAFLEAAMQACAHALDAVGRIEHTISVGGHTARLCFAGPALAERLMPALPTPPPSAQRHAPPSSLQVSLFDTASTGVPMPPPPWALADIRERGQIRGIDMAGPPGTGLGCSYDLGSGILTLYEPARRRALVWAENVARVPYYESAAPLRNLLSWWLADHGMQMAHAAGVGREGRGVLLTGAGGAGKTTTALACVAAGMAYAGDNNLLLAQESALVAHVMSTAATVRPRTLELLPSLRQRLENAERLSDEKGLVFVDQEPGVEVLHRFEVARILLPEVVGTGRTELVPATAGACFRALAPSSILSLPYAREAAFLRMARFARGAPAYHLRLGGDFDAVPGVVESALGGTSA